MAACPNCGRQTLRTKDWACQWCGYPLISRAFKKIDKTFKELQEERSLGSAAGEADAEAGYGGTGYEEETAPEPEFEPEPERKPQKEKKSGFSLFGKPKPRPEPAPRQEPPRAADRRPPQKAPPEHSVSYPASQPPPTPVYRPEPPTAKQEEAPLIIPPPAPKAERPLAPPFTPKTPPPAPPVYQPREPAAPAAKPEIVVEYQAPHVSSVKPEDIKDGMEISADDLDALFKADKNSVNSKLTGKTIVLNGVVEKVFIREHLDIRYIMVTGKKKLTWSCRCTFDKDTAAKASRLSENSDVAVRAKYDGYGKNIIFQDCEVL
jgi:hypothetical protein